MKLEVEIPGAWTYLFTYGYDLKIYGYGCLRIGIDANGKQVLGYVVPRREDV